MRVVPVPRLTRAVFALRAWAYGVLLLGLVGLILVYEVNDGKIARSLKHWNFFSPAPTRHQPVLAVSNSNYFPTLFVLLNRLRELENRELRVPLPQRTLDWEERAIIADELLNYSLTLEDRVSTTVSKMDSLIKLADTRNLGSRGKLLVAIEATISDPEKSIERLARIGLTELKFIDFLKTVDGELEPALECSKELLDRFPDDLLVAEFLESRVMMLLGRQEYDATIALMQQMLNAYQSSRSLPLEQVAVQLPDRILFVKMRYDQVIDELRQQKPGAVERYYEAISKVASNPRIGALAYEEILSAGSFFEQTGQFDYARDLYGLIGRKLSFHLDELIAQAAAEDSRLGLTRLESFGQKVDLKGSKPDGTIVEPKSYLDKIVVLYFWPGTQPDQSFKKAVELNATMRQFREAPVEFLGICFDSDSESRAVDTYTKVPNWHLKLEDHVAFVKQLSVNIGIPNRPYVVILDRTGSICAINVSSDRLRANLNELLFKRRDTRPSSTSTRRERVSEGNGTRATIQ